MYPSVLAALLYLTGILPSVVGLGNNVWGLLDILTGKSKLPQWLKNLLIEGITHYYNTVVTSNMCHDYLFLLLFIISSKVAPYGQHVEVPICIYLWTCVNYALTLRLVNWRAMPNPQTFRQWDTTLEYLCKIHNGCWHIKLQKPV